jgi:hypothetical protein
LHPSSLVIGHPIGMAARQEDLERAEQVVDHPVGIVVIQQAVLGDEQGLVLLPFAAIQSRKVLS